MYKITSFETKIVEIEVERFTEDTVWINGKKKRRSSSDEFYHDTWEDAWGNLLYIYATKFNNAVARLEYIKDEFDKVKNLKNPNS